VVGQPGARQAPRDCQPLYRLRQLFLWLPLHLRGQARSNLQILDFSWDGVRLKGGTTHPHSFHVKAVVEVLEQVEWQCPKTNRNR